MTKKTKAPSFEQNKRRNRYVKPTLSSAFKASRELFLAQAGTKAGVHVSF